MITLKVDWGKLPRIRDALGRFAREDMRAELAREFDDFTHSVLAETRIEIPWDTGALARGLTREKVSDFEYRLVNPIWYDKFVRYGTTTHHVVAGMVPRPVTKVRNYRGSVGAPNNWPQAVLSWPGCTHPVPYVTHKARAPNDYVERGWQASKPYLVAMPEHITHYFQKILDEA